MTDVNDLFVGNVLVRYQILKDRTSSEKSNMVLITFVYAKFGF